MRTRQEYEKLENEILAPYAMKSKDTGGREHEELVHLVRTCYQRDRDRVVHSEAFRKLEYKTQVFVIFEGDYYRTRLTHTIEVAQIARTIGRALQLNEDLIEAIALAHDLGHPPFGHAGEDQLNEIMRSFGGFNHNFRSYEIVTKLEKRYPDFDGLNLSEEVLVGILKHETNYDKSGDIAKYRGKGPTLEAKVVDVADSLAYLSHDIDDGLTSGCITGDDLLESKLWQKVYKQAEKLTASKNQEMLKYQIVKALIDTQMKDLLTQTTEDLNKLKFKSSDEVKGFHLKNPKERVVAFSPTMKEDRDHLQDLLLEKLYHHYRVERMTSKAKRIIQEIFDVYSENPLQLPYHVYPRSKKRVSSKEKKELDSETCKLIGNYIASMTDRFALDEHKKLFNPYQKV